MIIGFGYLVYFMIFIGVVKILGVIVVLLFGFFLLKEWVYVGFFFMMVGVVVFYFLVGDLFMMLFLLILLLVLIVLLWYFCLKFNRLQIMVLVKNLKVEFFFDKVGKWQEVCECLCKIVLLVEFFEEVKWGCLCYILDQVNIVFIYYFKEYCVFLFFKGVLMKDLNNILVQ